MSFSWSTHLLICLSLGTLTSIIRIGWPILVELIDVLNSVIIFQSEMTLLKWLTFSLWPPDSDSHSPALLNLFLSSDATVCSTVAFPPLGISDYLVVSVSIYFPSNLKRGTLFHFIAYDYSCVDWDGLFSHLRDVPWEDIFKLGALMLLVNFVCGFKLELTCISLNVNIRSSPTHLHGFQLFVLLTYVIEIAFFFCINRISLLNLK